MALGMLVLDSRVTLLLLHFLLECVARDEFHGLVLALKLNLDMPAELVLLRIISLLLRQLSVVGERALAARVEADHRLGTKAL